MKMILVFRPFLFLASVLLVVQLACSSASQPPISPSQQSGSGISTPNVAVNSDQIVISGALNKSYAPVNVSIGQFGPVAIRLYMNEPTPADLSRIGDLLTLDFPSDIQPGTYAFEDLIANPSANTWATYGTTDGQPTNFTSSQGTLVITSVGVTFSGQFQITAVDPTDSTRTIEITGSFTNLPFNQ